MQVEYLVAMRYIGQGYNVEAPIDAEILDTNDRGAIREAFEQAYRTQYGRTEPAMQVEIVSWRVLVSGPKPTIDLVAARPATVSGDACKGDRQVYFGPETGFQNAQVYDRYRLAPGAVFEGPAIFEERESTTVVPPGAGARIDDALNLVVDLPDSA
jgi:N-methylhydantoinase A